MKIKICRKCQWWDEKAFVFDDGAAGLWMACLQSDFYEEEPVDCDCMQKVFRKINRKNQCIQGSKGYKEVTSRFNYAYCNLRRKAGKYEIPSTCEFLLEQNMARWNNGH